MTSIQIGNQLHVFALVGAVTYHWWQDQGTTTWHVEQLPETEAPA